MPEKTIFYVTIFSLWMVSIVGVKVPHFGIILRGVCACCRERGDKQFMMDECFMRFYHFWSIRLVYVCGAD